MVSFLSRKKRRRRPTRRDFSAPQQRAPETFTRLSRAYREPSRPRWRRVVFAILLVLLIGGIGALLYSPVFTVQNIVITTVSSKTTEQRILELVRDVLSQRIWGILPANSLVFFRSGKARQAITSEFFLDTVEFSRHWPNVLKVHLPDNIVVALWQTDRATFLVDRRGVLVQQLSDNTIDDTLIRIQETGGSPRSLGDSVLTTKSAEAVSALNSVWQGTLKDIPLNYLEVEPNSLPTLKAYTTAGWYVLFSTESDIASQITAIRRLIDEKLKDQQSKIQYIDVRFGSRLYYKLNE